MGSESPETIGDPVIGVVREQLECLTERHSASRKLGQLVEELFMLPKAQCIHPASFYFRALHSSFPLIGVKAVSSVPE